MPGSGPASPGSSHGRSRSHPHVSTGLGGDEAVEVELPAGAHALRFDRVDTGLPEDQLRDAVRLGQRKLQVPCSVAGARRHGEQPGRLAGGDLHVLGGGAALGVHPEHHPSGRGIAGERADPPLEPRRLGHRCPHVLDGRSELAGENQSGAAVGIPVDPSGRVDAHAMSSLDAAWVPAGRRRSRVARRTSVSSASSALAVTGDLTPAGVIRSRNSRTEPSGSDRRA